METRRTQIREIINQTYQRFDKIYQRVPTRQLVHLDVHTNSTEVREQLTNQLGTSGTYQTVCALYGARSSDHIVSVGPDGKVDPADEALMDEIEEEINPYPHQFAWVITDRDDSRYDLSAVAIWFSPPV